MTTLAAFDFGQFLQDLLFMSPWLLIAFVIGGLIGPAVGRWFKKLFTK